MVSVMELGSVMSLAIPLAWAMLLALRWVMLLVAVMLQALPPHRLSALRRRMR
jgi:hypothetical protein